MHTIAFLNPHAHDFLATPVSFVILRRRGLKKYGFLFDQMIKRGQKIDILFDGTLSSLVPDRLFNKLPRFIGLLILKMEVALWRKINGLNNNKVCMHYGLNKPRHVKALFLFSYKDCVGSFEKRRSIIQSFPLALVHLSHYMVRTAEKAKNLSYLTNVVLVGDSDISSNSYFKAHFGWYQRPVEILPFCVSPRFQVTIPFEKRERKCVASGSFHNLTQEVPARFYQDFMKYFGSDTYHPIRKMLYENREHNKEWLTCLVSAYRGDEKVSKNALGRLVKYLFVRQKKYFSINIVEEYNRHQFSLVGEELSGFPALGAFEAMACGSVLLAGGEDYYRGLGMKVGKHYLLHDGTVEGIHKIVKELVLDQERVQMIAKNGREYVEQYIRGGVAFNRLVEMIGGI